MYYNLYAFLTIIIIIIIIGCCCCCCCCYISTQASSNSKACADWPILRGTRRSDYLITGRARGTREGGEAGLLSFSLLVRPRHFFFHSHKKSYDSYDEKDYSGTFMRASKYGKNLAETDQGRGCGGEGDKPSFVLHWFF